jgi:hypothetical protein
MSKETPTKPSAPLIIGRDDRARLHRLRDFAAKRPVSMPEIIEALKTPDGKRAHMKNMTAQTVKLANGPWDFFVTFSIETGHPIGACRHMSMSIMREDRVPSLEAVWLIAMEFGFSGGLDACQRWIEDLSDGGRAVNIVQPLAVEGSGHA